MTHPAFWEFIAGLGFFLYGMNLLENTLKLVSGRSLKLFLKRNTQSVFKSIFGGALVTGIVQSSSVVSLIVLAFVEAGVISFRNAMSVILGTNLGTTLDSWIVATVGFKMNVLEYALPVIGVSAIGMYFFESRQKIYNLIRIFFSLGILFLGLSFMKSGALYLVDEFDISVYANYGSLVFVLIGFLLTTIIQSSSATVAITLTAIYAGIISFPLAAAVVIGSEVGTTIKFLLWGMRGEADKKRVAVGNFIYNIFTSLIAFSFLAQIIYFIEHIIGIADPLIGLVFFQTSINIIAIILFVPMLNVFTSWLESKFISSKNNDETYFGKHLSSMPILGIDVLKEESHNLLRKSLVYVSSELNPNHKTANGILENIKSFTRFYNDPDKEYLKLKRTEGDIFNFSTTIQENNLSKDEILSINNYTHAARSIINACKSIKDIRHNLDTFESSVNDHLHQQINIIRKDWQEFESAFLKNLNNQTQTKDLSSSLNTQALDHEHLSRLELIGMLKENSLSGIDASSLMNVQKEIRACKTSLIEALSMLRS